MTHGEALAAVMMAAAIVLALTTRGSVSRLACSMLAGLLAVRLAIWYAPHDWRYLASAAIWVSVGVAAIQRGTAASGALLIVSGLCYGVAEMVAAPASVGSPALVLADVFWWGALLWGARRGYIGLDQGGFVGGDSRGRGYLACDCAAHDQAQARKAVKP